MNTEYEDRKKILSAKEKMNVRQMKMTVYRKLKVIIVFVNM